MVLIFGDSKSATNNHCPIMYDACLSPNVQSRLGKVTLQ